MNDSPINSHSAAAQNTADGSFREFLSWLDEGEDSEGRSYLEMQMRLAAFFDRRNCVDPEGLADETLARAARRFREEGSIQTDSPAKYCYTLARFVLLEYFRSSKPREVSLDDAPPGTGADPIGEETERRETMLGCLDKCSEKLEPEQREMIFKYYQGERRVKIENRRRMAEMMGVSVNALSIRACRIREKLEACVKKCAATG